MLSDRRSIVAFFAGTCYEFTSDNASYVVKRADLGLAGYDYLDLYPDESFRVLSNSIICLDTTVFGYSGCHQRGGGVYAGGIEEPANHLLQRVREEARFTKKISVILTAHSRGCLSAYLFAKKVAADPKLRDRVEITLDMRDPVPGNLRVAAALDAAKVTTIASKLSDLSECKNIKDAHITVVEEGMFRASFDVLIPKFSSKTKLDVEFIPGTHNIQETPDNDNANPNNKFNQSLHAPARDNTLYYIGLCESLQVYIENDVQANVRNTLIPIIDFAKNYQDKATGQQIKDIISNLNFRDSKANTIQSLIKLQVLLYKMALANEMARDLTPNKTTRARGVHFGGSFVAHTIPSKATHLNERHVRLDNLLQSNILKDSDVNILLKFEGTRGDFNRRNIISKRYDELQTACKKYEKQLNKKLDATQHTEGSLNYLRIEGQAKFLVALSKTLHDKPYDMDQMLTKIRAFESEFAKTKAFFTGEYGAKFKSNVGNVLLSIATLGIYAGVRAIHSKVTRGYFAFWKQRKEVFMDDATSSLAATPCLQR